MSGEPDNSPAPASDLRGTITLGTVVIPPYPSLSARTSVTDRRLDLAIRVTQDQTLRYTMEDLSEMEERLGRLEYYTALTLLEKSANDLQIPSEANTALNRFKNGIMVDNFTTLSIADTASTE